jgi:hypothetical protein
MESSMAARIALLVIPGPASNRANPPREPPRRYQGAHHLVARVNAKRRCLRRQASLQQKEQGGERYGRCPPPVLSTPAITAGPRIGQQRAAARHPAYKFEPLKRSSGSYSAYPPVSNRN